MHDNNKLGGVWYYLEHVPGGDHRIKQTIVIGETPRKWILRPPNLEDLCSNVAPGDYFWDFSIPKKGQDAREGLNFRKTKRHFFASEARALQEITDQQAQRWVYEHAWRIADVVRHVRDPITLRKIAELVGYKETP